MEITTQKFAIFDFDGTLVAKDTFVALLKKGFKTEPWRCLLLIPFCPIFLCILLFNLDRTVSKSALLWCITVFKTKKQIIHFFNHVLKEEYKNLWFKEGLQELETLYNNNINVVIATASGQIWIRSLLRSKFTKSRLIIGTKLRFCAGGVCFASKNCRDGEKLKRIRQQLGHDFIWESSWSDHIADIPILKNAQTPYIICPTDKHIPVFKKEFGEDVKILNWSKITP